MNQNLKQLFIFFSIFNYALNLSGQSPSFEWARMPAGNGIAEGVSICVDNSGNSYSTGYINNILSNTQYMFFGTDTVISNPYRGNFFVVKYDINGNVLWARSGLGNGSVYSRGITIDLANNIYVYGSFYSSSTLQIGNVILTSNGNNDLFIAKYDSSGNLMWAKSFGGTNFEDGSSIQSDQSCNIIIAGYFLSAYINFGVYQINNSTGQYYPFIVKLDSSGNGLWAKNGIITGGFDGGFCSSIVSDINDNYYACGNFSGTQINFDNNILLNKGSSDIFLLKINSAGNIIWARSFGTADGESANSITVDKQGNPCFTGVYQNQFITNDTLAFDSFKFVGSAMRNTYIAKFDTSGIAQWVISSDSGSCAAYYICSDNCNNILVSGSLMNASVYFGNINLFSPVMTVDNLFLLQLDSYGNIIWSATSTAGGDDQMGIAVDSSFNYYLCGDFIDSIIMGPDTLIHNSDEWPVIAKLNYSCNINSVKNETEIETNLYPNPITDMINVSINKNQDAIFILYDIFGRVIKQIRFNSSFTLFCPEIKNGIYIYKIINDYSTLKSGKIIKI